MRGDRAPVACHAQRTAHVAGAGEARGWQRRLRARTSPAHLAVAHTVGAEAASAAASRADVDRAVGRREPRVAGAQPMASACPTSRAAEWARDGAAGHEQDRQHDEGVGAEE